MQTAPLTLLTFLLTTYMITAPQKQVMVIQSPFGTELGIKLQLKETILQATAAAAATIHPASFSISG